MSEKGGQEERSCCTHAGGQGGKRAARKQLKQNIKKGSGTTGTYPTTTVRLRFVVDRLAVAAAFHMPFVDTTTYLRTRHLAAVNCEYKIRLTLPDVLGTYLRLVFAINRSFQLPVPLLLVFLSLLGAIL